MKIALLIALLCAVAACLADQSSLEKMVASRLPALGHRNWIVVADSAYPLQTSPGIETVTVNESQITAVKAVLAALSKAKNVRPVIHLDQELAYVPNSSAPEIDRYRADLKRALGARAVDHSLHEDIIRKLDEAGKTFKVLLIKTPHTMPYTSVFFELQCGYWSDAAEKKLRDAMKGH